jgi:hypothetical protein
MKPFITERKRPRVEACYNFVTPLIVVQLTNKLLNEVLEPPNVSPGGHKLGVNGLAVDAERSILYVRPTIRATSPLYLTLCE